MTVPVGREGATLVDLVEQSAGVHADRAALVTRVGLRDDVWTYARLWRAVMAIAEWLVDDAAVRPGERVALIGPNEPRLVAASVGVMLAGGIVVPVEQHATPAFVERVLTHTQAVLLLAGGDPPKTGCCPVRPLASLPIEPTRPIVRRPVAADVAEIVSTSGTTGHPKAVVLTHANVMANVRSVRGILPQREDYRLLSVLPLSHMLEQTAGLFVPLLYGASITYPSSRQPAVVLDTLRRGRATTMVVVPQVMQLLLDGIERSVEHAGAGRRWRRSQRLAERLPFRARRVVFRPVLGRLGGALDLLISGGASLPEPLAAAWERMGVAVLNGYGTTECSPIISTTSLDDRPLGSDGPPVPGVEVRIDSEGEIQVRGASVTAGYWHDDEATAAAFTPDGWYRTGDTGALDARGHLHVRGRLRDLIVLASGLKVQPEDVEQALLAEPQIADCVVLTRPDERGTPHIHAAVRCDPAIPAAERRPRVAEAVRRANAVLAAHQRISGFTLWEEDDFPRTAARKVRRGEVAARLAGEPAHDLAPSSPPALGDERLARARELLASVCDVPEESLAPEADLALDLGLDSVGQLELAVALEGALGIRFEDSDLARIRTVGDLLGMLDEHERVAVEAVTEPAAWARAAPARAAREALQRGVLFPASRLACRPFVVDGTQHLSGLSPPLLLVANHASHLDAVSILRALPAHLRRRTAVAAAADTFFTSRLLGGVVSLVLCAFPFSRTGRTRESLESCGMLADDGWSVLVFPEGTRSLTGGMGPFRGGIGVLALGLRAPVVPISVTGTFELLPKGARRPGRGPVSVWFGPPVELPAGVEHEQATALIEDAVRGLVERAARGRRSRTEHARHQ